MPQNAPLRGRTQAAIPPAAMLLVAMLLVLGSCGRGAPPNIVLVTVDTLRADHLGGGGRPGAFTPFIDAFLAESTSFPEAIAPRSQTWPTLASILTGQSPVVHGIRRNGQPMVEGIPTLEERLAEQGYACAAFLSNAGQAGWPGFDPVADLRDQDERLLGAAKGWMRGQTDRPFFLWIHFFGPHRPYGATPPWTDRFDPGYAGPIDGSIEQMTAITTGALEPTPADVAHMIARYDAEIGEVDRHFGDLLRHLDLLGIRGNTIVALTADHGEELYERHRYWSHSASIYDTVLRVPLAFRWPGRIRAGQRNAGLAASVDIAPTLLRLAGGRPLEGDGRDLGAALTDGAPADPDRAVVSELEDLVVSVRTADWRYIHNPAGNAFPMEGGELGLAFPFAERELYDHRTDPGERDDVSGAHPDVSEDLADRVEAWMHDHDWEASSRRHRQTEVPEGIRESLEAIGYLN